MKVHRSIRTAHSNASDARRAVREFHAEVRQPGMELVIFFCSSQYDLEALADEMNRLFAGVRVLGCTTASQTAPAGLPRHGLTGLSLPVGGCAAATAFIDRLQDFELAGCQAFATSLMKRLEVRSAADADRCFAFLLTDGLSNRVEVLVRTLQNALGRIPLIGCSTAGDVEAEPTWIFHDGAFHRDAAVLVLAGTDYPLKILKTQHVAGAAERLVVTKADTAQRLVKEINGLPAAAEYARLVGLPVRELTPACFAAYPIVVLIDGTDHVRLIRKANPDGSLSFHSAIGEGLVLRVAHGDDLPAPPTQAFDTASDGIGGKAEAGANESGPAVGSEAAGKAKTEEIALRQENLRLKKIINALMNRAEAAMGAHASDFGMFQTAIQLENQIRTRTRELEAAQHENERINRALQRAIQELEAFSYSVAHDLRAPLRAIDGFSAILQRNHADQLDAEGGEHLRRVREGAQRMGQLIDDLLHLSRCSRADLRRETVDLATLARQIIDGFRQAQPDRQVEFIVADSLPVQGDSRLLAVLLENLLGNAWKYTRRRAEARIEFGYDPALAAYYVRDNGAGFDMAYAGKLFQVFQRLHTVAEFEGTGIGLAIVHRIVERHGGRVWAEGKVDEGAIVRFTLPCKMPSAELPTGQTA